ncbi:MAG: serine/threonine-protein phosphatase [Bacteroidetes bacterium]|nr:MAG: serine/threonine-protein phosphatase [Bacteroidota bacterium]
MFEENNFKKIYAFLGIISWFLLIAMVLLEQYYTLINEKIIVPDFFKALSVNSVILFTYLYVGKRNELEKSIDFYNILFSLFLTAVICTLASVLLNLFMQQLSYDFDDPSPMIPSILLHNLCYHIELGFLIFFLTSTFLKWKKLISYRKLRITTISWRVFEYMLIFSMLLHFFHFHLNDTFFNVLRIIFAIFSVGLAFNLSWVTYFDFRQKLSVLFFLISILLCLFYFGEVISQYSDISPLVVDLSRSIFLHSLLIFIAIYGSASILVVLFNLPTSSIFEEKFSNVLNYQRLSELILEGENEKQVYELLVESAIHTLKADAVWLEIMPSHATIYRRLEDQEMEQIREALQKTGYDPRTTQTFDRKHLSQFIDNLAFNSVLAVPLLSYKQELLGILVLLKKLNNAFDNVMINLVNSYSAQASITLDNFRLVSEVVENERSKAEMLTAKKVQIRLLPHLAIAHEKIEILASSFSPDEVGGDYYDCFQISESKYAVIIADVSGKGTSAAFYMAQMKGIFHSLVQLDLTPDEFLKYANSALCRCLEKSYFVTALYLLIDTQTQKMYYSRAGHCPLLFFNSQTKTAEYLESKGMGLGIIKSEKFEKYIDIRTFNYQAGDQILLFTDGIVEAKDKEDPTKEYGYLKLKTFFEDQIQLSLADFSDALVADIQDFAGTKTLDDDYTLLILKLL